MTNVPFTSLDQLRDVESLNHHAEAVAAGEDPADVMAAIRAVGRDNARTPMQWDASPHAGFTTGTPWIDVNPDHDRINVAADVADPDGVFAHHRHLVELRHAADVVVHGDFTMLLPDDEEVYAFTRRLDGVTLLVLCNVSGRPAAPAVPDAATWAGAEVVSANLGPADGQRWPGDGTVALRPWEALVLRA